MASTHALWSLKREALPQNDDVTHQYSNLDLNPNHKCLNQSFVQSNSKSVVNNKGLGLLQHQKTDSKCVESKNKKGSLNLWNKSSSNQTFKFFSAFDEVGKDDGKKRWKNKSSSNSKINSSTLSLHIAAYENSIEGGDTVTLDKIQGLKKKEKTSGSIEDKEQVFIDSTLNPSEFPRQQRDDVSKPEVMQFKASQQLLNPNQSGSSNNGQQGIQKVPVKPHNMAGESKKTPTEGEKKLKPCCVCLETKKARDECVLLNGEEHCLTLIEAHKKCLRDLGFEI